MNDEVERFLFAGCWLALFAACSSKMEKNPHLFHTHVSLRRKEFGQGG